jgi:hypothetical protein
MHEGYILLVAKLQILNYLIFKCYCIFHHLQSYDIIQVIILE